MNDLQEDESVLLLRQATDDIQYAIQRIREWPNPPDPSLVAAWAPLLNEKLTQIKEVLSRCEYRLQPVPQKPDNSENVFRMGMTLQEVEKIHIIRTLRLYGGNREKTAGTLAIGARTLYRKLNDYGIH